MNPKSFLKTCGKCGGKITKPGPCPICEDNPFGKWSIKIDETKSCRERGDHVQNCHNCPDTTCGDNINPDLKDTYEQKELPGEIGEWGDKCFFCGIHAVTAGLCEYCGAEQVDADTPSNKK